MYFCMHKKQKLEPQLVDSHSKIAVEVLPQGQRPKSSIAIAISFAVKSFILSTKIIFFTGPRPARSGAITNGMTNMTITLANEK